MIKEHTVDRPILDCRLTSIDNPYDPFKDFAEWYKWDVMNGYNSCGILARLAPVNDETPDNEYYWWKEDIIDMIVETHPSHMYTKVSKPIGESNS